MAAEPESSSTSVYSALVRERDVIVSTDEGVYWASPEDKDWHPLSKSNTLPVGGYFATVPRDRSTLLYVVADELYLSEDVGQPWRLVADGYDFSDVFLHRNGTLYATTLTHNTDKCSPQTGETLNAGCEAFGIESYSVLISHDMGKTWKDITNGIERGIPDFIYEDPDHPDLVILIGQCFVRMCVWQATSESYQWTEHLRHLWIEKHDLETVMFNPHYFQGFGFGITGYLKKPSSYFE